MFNNSTIIRFDQYIYLMCHIVNRCIQAIKLIMMEDDFYLSIIFKRPPGNHNPISPVYSQPSSSTTSLLSIKNVRQGLPQQIRPKHSKHTATKRCIRLHFIFVIAFENNGAPDTNLSTRMRLIHRCVIHLWNINKLDFWKCIKASTQVT